MQEGPRISFETAAKMKLGKVDGAGIREGVRSYSVYGKQTLDDGAEVWTPVADGDEGNYRFFKVGVGMPR